MALLGQAAMVAIYDLEAGWEAKHDDWHSHEHMHERVGIPGFLREDATVRMARERAASCSTRPIRSTF